CVAYSTLLEALRSVWSCRLHPVERSEPTHLVLRRAALRKGPVAAFPEGVTSNGRVLLHCLPMFDETPAFSAYVVAAVRYRPTESHASAVFTGAEGSAALHMFRLAMNPSNGVQRIYRQQGSVSSPHWQQQMFTAIANMLRIPRAQIGAAHKHGFLTFYRRTSL
ncbi:MAG: hypothetical protein Q8P67_06790, partial [archaeon]|nr:hypothetical protein [archaeon]